MNKVLFFDADGVTIVQREKFFSQRFSEDYGQSTDVVMPLFKNEFYKCVLGEMDLKDVLKSYLPKWSWQGTVDELLEYWWAGENKINMPVVEKITELRAKGYRCYLATDQEKYRANYIMKGMGMEKYVDGAFFSCDLGISKGKREYWEKVLKSLSIDNPGEVEYWDDEIENIQAAQEAGIKVHLFKNPSELSDIK